MKNVLKKVLPGVYFLFSCSFLFSMTVSAYIDPSTTAMLTQILAGVFISIGVMFGIFRTKILLFFKNLKVKSMQKKLEKQASSKDKE